VHATSLHAGDRSVELSDGRHLTFDATVIATGASPRHLTSGHDLQGTHVLRTLADALALQRTLVAGTHLVIVGGGFLGLEVAATAQQLGVEVDVIEPLPVCLEGPLGRAVGERVMALHAAHGVRLHNGVGVSRLISMSNS
jgi:NADPH-dependent 2,4-dienoyl-CoA reductase/sulfur reductase-like enzyme